MNTAEHYMQHRGALYHFASDTLRDGSPLPKAGDASHTITDIKPCVRGWHASDRPIDALHYAPGPYVARVLLRGNVIAHGNPVDKYVGESRETLTDYVDVSDGLRLFARQCALDVINLWDAPDIVRRYLETGSESIRAATRDATRAAALAAAIAASRAAASAAAQDAAQDAASAAWDAQNDRLATIITDALT